jgi:hypothetical protein
MQHLLPQLEQFCTAGNVNDENIVVDFLKTTTMVGLLPVKSVCLSTATLCVCVCLSLRPHCVFVCVSVSTTTLVGLFPVRPRSPQDLVLLLSTTPCASPRNEVLRRRA